MSVDLSKMDDKDAALKMKLSKRGYRAEVNAPVSANQWGAIQAILGEQDSEIGRQMLDLFRTFLAARQEQSHEA